MKKDIEEKIKKFEQVLEAKNIPFDSLFLFGSAARDTMHEWSDIDLAVVGPAFGKDSIDESVRLRCLAYTVDPALDPFPMRPEDLEDRFSTIGTAIKKEGIQIH